MHSLDGDVGKVTTVCADVAEIGIQGGPLLDLTTGSQPIRILVVEDHEPFRSFISSMLRQQSKIEIVGEEQDGLRAVQQAEALQPDLILLDIGLPELNGLEAARRIRQGAPTAKIVFLTQETAPEVVGEAFATGAQGYLVKTHASSELLPALEAILGGSRFISHGLNGHRPTGRQAKS